MVAVDDHWLERWYLLLIVVLVDVRRWRSNTVYGTHILSVIVPLGLLARVSLRILRIALSPLLSQIILNEWLMVLLVR